MKVLVTGVKGQLGYDCVNELTKRNHETIGVDIEEMDITDLASVETVLKNVAPDAVIHCAAWTAVDAAEDEENKEKVHQVNAVGTDNIAKVCKELNCKMMYISTDYVFNGLGEEPWNEECTDYAPLNVYGESKLAGELAVSKTLDHYFIVRIAWVFGKNGNNFIKTMLNVGKRFPRLTVVNDQIGTPTYTYD
ncbi:MAG: sugar nucleotide-binding protein, partial [Eubacteriales bacterium]